MNAPYEEIIAGESLLRYAPGERHELVCRRLHDYVAACLVQVTVARLLPPRTVIQLAPGTLVRPDLTLVTAANGKPWLLAEVVESDDHRADTVIKKNLYEDLKIPRLWMVDPRYHNLEVYHGSPHGLALKQIMAGREVLTETLLPALAIKVTDLFDHLPA
ncbi:MAG: Uma2 family endonuclease [Verrucomicrobiota bacterium]